MPDVAIVAGDAFPPSRHAGVHRVLGWVRYLPSFGWDPVVAAVPADYRPVEARDSSLLGQVSSVPAVRPRPLFHSHSPGGDRAGGAGRESRLLAATKALVVPDVRILWALPAARALVAHGRSKPIDAVVSTSPEASSHVAAAIVARRMSVPWIADVRDPWVSVWRRPGPSRAIQERIARRVLRRADHVTTVAPSLARLVVERYGVHPDRVSVLWHGYEQPPAGPATRGPGITVVHTGKFYGRRTPHAFLEAARRVAKDEAVTVRFLGEMDAETAAAVRPFSDEPWFHNSGPVPHDRALAEQLAADVLLLIPGPDTHTIPSKAFEYLAAGRPIVYLGEERSEAFALLRDTSDVTRADQDDVSGIEAALRNAIAAAGRRPSKPLPAHLERRVIVGELAAILDRLTADR